MHSFSWMWLTSHSSSNSHQEWNCTSGWFGIREVTNSSVSLVLHQRFSRGIWLQLAWFAVVFLSHLCPLGWATRLQCWIFKAELREEQDETEQVNPIHVVAAHKAGGLWSVHGMSLLRTGKGSGHPDLGPEFQISVGSGETMLFKTFCRRCRAALPCVLLSHPPKPKQNVKTKKPDKQNSPKTWRNFFFTTFSPPRFSLFPMEKPLHLWKTAL